jgi:hypothetical protein
MDIRVQEKAAERAFLKRFQDRYELAQAALQVLTDGLALLDGRSLKEEPARVRSWLAIGNRNALLGALTLLARGYFRESVAVLRAAFEDWAIQRYLSLHPDRAVAYGEIDMLSPFKPARTEASATPRFETIWAELDREGSNDARRVYAWLCAYTHPTAVGVRSSYERDATGFTARLAPAVDPALTRHALAYWLQTAQLQLRATQQLQSLVLGESDAGWGARATALSNELDTAMKSMAREIMENALDSIGEELRNNGLSLEELIESGRGERAILLERGTRPNASND